MKSLIEYFKHNNMKTFTEYNDDLEFNEILNEGLFDKIFSFFKKIFKKTNKDKIEVKDANTNLKKSKPLSLENIDNDAFMQIISDKHVGFAILNKMLKNKNNYFIYDKKSKTEYKPEFNAFFYKDKKHINYVGILGIDKNINIIDDYLTIFVIDVAVNITNYNDVIKFIINDLINELKKEYKGFVIKPQDPTLINIIKKAGFKPMDKKREIYKMEL
jgi:hypothetical protein